MKNSWERSKKLITVDKNLIKQLFQPILNEKQKEKLKNKSYNYHLLSGGLVNSNYIVNINKRENFLLRIYNRESGICKKEFNVINLVKGKIPVPKIFYHSTVDDISKFVPFGYIIQEFVEGNRFADVLKKSKSRKFAINKEKIKTISPELGKILSKIHSYHFEKSGFLNSNLKISEELVINKKTYLPLIKFFLIENPAGKRLGNKLTEKLLKFVKDKKELFDFESNKNHYHLLHGDFNAENILIDLNLERNNIITSILDWEYIFSGSNLFDIGNLFRYDHLFDANFEKKFIEAYQKNGELLPKNWKKLSKLYDLVSLLSMLIRNELGTNILKDIKFLISEMLNKWATY